MSICFVTCDGGLGAPNSLASALTIGFVALSWPRRQRAPYADAPQAMRKLQEPSQIVQCRQADVSVVESAMPKAQQRYKATYKQDAPQLTLDRKHFLPKAAASQEEDDDPDHPTWYAPRAQSVRVADRCFPSVV